MNPNPSSIALDPLEARRLMAFSAYAQLIDQDLAAGAFPGVTGKGVTVAVIDTGVDYKHPNLGGGIGKNRKVIGGYDFVDNDADPMDKTGHGTAVAAAIAASPYTVGGVTHQGVAPDAKIVALRVGGAGTISNDRIERALRWIVNNHRKYNISIVNLSLGSGSFTNASTADQLSDELGRLRRLGIFITAASGNNNEISIGPISSDGVAYPAADPSVFAVGAVDSRDIITTWAQRGDELDLLAPGEDIVLPARGGGFDVEDGTSFSAPMVAGAAALIKQLTPAARPGDIGSILMASGAENRDGDVEAGNTTRLLFGRLDLDDALRLARQRAPRRAGATFGNVFDTALDAQGVLHVAYYDPRRERLMYTTRTTAGRWSSAAVVDAAGDVGSQLSIAVDSTGKAAVAYYDATDADLKYASFDGADWSVSVIDADGNVGESPSIGFDIDGNAYVAYYRRTSGDLRLATHDRDRSAWTVRTVDGLDGNVGAVASIDVGEAAIASGFFTQYDTTVAIAYADSTNGNLKYARLDVDDFAATWFIAVVDNTRGVDRIDLNLHAGPSGSGLQAQIAYRDTRSGAIKYAFRNRSWFKEVVARGDRLGDAVQLFFDANDRPMIAYTIDARNRFATSTRIGADAWRAKAGSGAATILNSALNERTDDVALSWVNEAGRVKSRLV